jgi:arsenical pump membrane protein
MLALEIVVAAAAAVTVARGRAGTRAVAVATGLAALELSAGVVPLRESGAAVRATAPIALFLTAALWLAGLCRDAGVADRLAGLVGRCSGGRPALTYAVTCVACAALTAAVSLDGAVVLMVPLVTALSRGRPALQRPFLLGTVCVANAFSLAVPQGNPTNLVLMEQLGIGPATYLRHLFLPGVAAGVVAALSVAWAERAALRHARLCGAPAVGPLRWREGAAIAALGAATVAAAVFSWLGLPPWLGVGAVVAAAWAIAVGLRARRPRLAPPWRISLVVGALLVLAAPLGPPLAALAPRDGSPAALAAAAVVAAVAACGLNNLPASVLVASVLGRSTGSLPYASITGLSVGALATPHGSVATLIAFDQVPAVGARGGVLLIAAAVATVVATAALMLGGVA